MVGASGARRFLALDLSLMVAERFDDRLHPIELMLAHDALDQPIPTDRLRNLLRWVVPGDWNIGRC